MIASRVFAIVLAAATLALSATATRATILAVNGGGNTPHATPKLPDALSDLPKPSPSPNLASPQPGGTASSHAGWGKWEVQIGTKTRGTRINPKADSIKSTSIPKSK